MKQFLRFVFCGILVATSSIVSARQEVARARSSGTPSASSRNRLSVPNSGSFSCALNKARAYLRSHSSKFHNDDVITLVDLSQDRAGRMMIVDAKTGAILEVHAVARGSGKVGNSSAGGHGSPLGFMRVSETYHGKHGLSARIDGLEPGINGNTRSRAVVIHPASYVSDGGYAGHSWGCFAVDPNQSAHIIQKLQGGSLMYAYTSTTACQ